MAIRKVPDQLKHESVKPLSKAEIETLKKNQPAISWHTLHCELVTPMYGGGVESAKVDTAMPIRASSIRGQLRFWWRLLAKHKWKLGDNQAIRTAEFELWGGMNDGDDDGKAGKVLLRVTNVPNSKQIENNLVEYREYIGTQNNRKLEYILFPASNADDRQNNPHKLLNPNNITWDLEFAFSPNILNIHKNIGNDKPNPKEQVIETLRWWANFGGLGFRSRKGLGAVYVSQCQDFPEICQPLTPDDVAQAGCRLAIRMDSFPDGLRALQAGVQKLSDFRQGAEIGRNKPSQQQKPAGRSRWPEPDAIRSITGDYLALTEENKDRRPTDIVKNHKPVHQAGVVFPRAVFGLPIIYKFINDEYYDKKNPKDRDEKKQRIIYPDQHEPLPTTISLATGERLASPLILRPIYTGHRNGQTQWQAGALVLPYEHILKEKVKIGNNYYPIWQDDTAQYITPVRENGGIDPLQAFLAYFEK